MEDLWVNLDKRSQEFFVQLYICTIVSLYLSSKKKIKYVKKKWKMRIKCKIIIIIIIKHYANSNE